MAKKPLYGRFQSPGSLIQLEKFADGWNSQEAGFLLPLAHRDYRYHYYQFGTTQTMTTELTAANGGGASVSDFAILGTTENGNIRGTTGTGTRTTSIIQIKQNALNYDAARNPGGEIRFQVSAITDLAIEFEFLGVEPGTEALHNQSALSAAGVPTIVSNTSTDQFGIALNITSGTLHTAALISKGSTDAAAGALLGTNVPTVATYTVWRIQGRQNGCYAIIDDVPSQSAGLSLGPDTAVLMRPSFLVSNDGAGGSKTCSVNYMRFWAEWA
jgi:hypothetical protein